MRRGPRPRDHRRLPVIRLLLSLIAAARAFFRSRADIALEVLALRQQIAVLKRKRPRPRLSPLDRLFWTVLRTTWSHWRDALVIVKPETVVGWHRAGFRLYWHWKSRPFFCRKSAHVRHASVFKRENIGESDIFPFCTLFRQH